MFQCRIGKQNVNGSLCSIRRVRNRGGDWSLILHQNNTYSNPSGITVPTFQAWSSDFLFFVFVRMDHECVSLLFLFVSFFNFLTRSKENFSKLFCSSFISFHLPIYIFWNFFRLIENITPIFVYGFIKISFRVTIMTLSCIVLAMVKSHICSTLNS